MTLVDPLCPPPPSAPAGCCDQQSSPARALSRPANPPGLSVIRYRLGTFTTFRRAMLEDVPRPDLLFDLLSTGLDKGQPNPFRAWREGSAGDYQTALLELWAYLADILTFYQERIANEAFLPTATQRDSLRRLVELVAYRPAPGAAASALVAFSLEEHKVLGIPAGFRVASRATPGKPSAIFETAAAIAARADHNALPVAAAAPTNQFASPTDYAAVLAADPGDPAQLARAAASLYGAAASTYVATLAPAPGSAAAGQYSSPSAFPLLAVERQPASGSQSGSRDTLRTVVLEGVLARPVAGDYVLVVDKQGQRRRLWRLTAVAQEPENKWTKIVWSEPPNTAYDPPVAVYALRVAASPFGSAAPRWDTLPATLTNADGGHSNAPYDQKNWDAPTKPNNAPNPWFYLPTPGDPTNVVFLDGVYEGVGGTPEHPDWVVLLAEDNYAALKAIDARTVSKSAYAITAKVTRLSLAYGESVPGATFPLRDTAILAGAEPLTPRERLPLPQALSGKTILLAGQHPELKEGQTIVVQGSLYDPATGGPGSFVSAETATVDAPPACDAARDLTTVTLKSTLAHCYARAATVLLANVAPATHGETVRDEVLGSGDGSAFQSYALKKKPLTYLPATGAEGLAGVESTLEVAVGGVRWTERPTLLDSLPNAQEFTTAQDDAGQTTVAFGDGVNGARPPTGRDNIHARYRKGLGTAGNVDAAAIAQLIDSKPGLDRVTNPLPALGGADPETADQIRQRAPSGVATFGRAVGLTDFEALALTYPGVAKASASWMRRDPQTLRAIPHPYVRLVVAAADRTPLAEQRDFARRLRAFLDRRRDPNLSLRLDDYKPVYVDVAAQIDVDDRYPRQATLARALAALNPDVNPDGSAGFFAFERLCFGQSIHLSAVYAALQAIPGVKNATITRLRRLPEDAATPDLVRDHVPIGPTELAAIENDPARPERGMLTITLGVGGFADT